MSGFDKIIGCNDIKEALSMYADVLKNPNKYKKYGLYLPGWVLISGDHCSGKTMLAEQFILQAGLKSYTVREDLTDEDSISYITNSFIEAECTGSAIVFIDDVDQLKDDAGRKNSAMVYNCLQSCIDDYCKDGVFTIVTARSVDKLPASLLNAGKVCRKFNIHYSEDEKKEILKSILKDNPVSEDIEISALSSVMPGYSFNDYKKVINEAGIKAVFDGRNKICNDDIIKAVSLLIH